MVLLDVVLLDGVLLEMLLLAGELEAEKIVLVIEELLVNDVVVAALKDALAVVVLEDSLDVAVGLPLVLIETRLLKLVLPAIDVPILVELEVLEHVLPTMAVSVLEELELVDAGMIVMLAAVEELGLLVTGTVEMPQVLIATAVDDAVVELEEDDVTVQLPGDEIAEGRGCRTYP